MRAAPKFATNVEALTVNRPDAGKSLQDFLAARLGLSRRAAKAVIDGRSVWVNRRCVWIAHHPLKTGDAVEIPDGWLPVFWACGVTPQAAIAASGVPFAIGHAPGHMLITDAPNASYQVP